MMYQRLLFGYRQSLKKILSGQASTGLAKHLAERKKVILAARNPASSLLVKTGFGRVRGGCSPQHPFVECVLIPGRSQTNRSGIMVFSTV